MSERISNGLAAARNAPVKLGRWVGAAWVRAPEPAGRAVPERTGPARRDSGCGVLAAADVDAGSSSSAPSRSCASDWVARYRRRASARSVLLARATLPPEFIAAPPRAPADRFECGAHASGYASGSSRGRCEVAMQRARRATLSVLILGFALLGAVGVTPFAPPFAPAAVVGWPASHA